MTFIMSVYGAFIHREGMVLPDTGVTTPSSLPGQVKSGTPFLILDMEWSNCYPVKLGRYAMGKSNVA